MGVVVKHLPCRRSLHLATTPWKARFCYNQKIMLPRLDSCWVVSSKAGHSKPKVQWSAKAKKVPEEPYENQRIPASGFHHLLYWRWASEIGDTSSLVLIQADVQAQTRLGSRPCHQGNVF